jgi:hypothetical protein
MPEFHDRYDAATVSGRISQPPFAELVDRGRRRAHRTRAVRLAGVAVVAALAATSLLALPGRTGPSTPAGSAPPSDEDVVRDAVFLNPDYGAVVYFHSETCAEWVAVTEDGGLTWSEPQEVPVLPGEEAVEAELHCLLADVVPIATGTIVRSAVHTGYQLAYRAAGIDLPTTGYMSHDGGQTWREYEPRVRTTEAVPDGVVPDVYCETTGINPDQEYPDYRDDQDYTDVAPDLCETARIGWLDPETGDQVVLRNDPRAATMYTPSIGSDGSVWVGGSDADGDYHISVSRDRGRNWEDVSPPPGEDLGPEMSSVAAVTAADGDTAYFRADTEPGGPVRPPKLYRTTDGGETWQPLPAAAQLGDVAGMWVANDGTLFAVDMRVSDPDRPEEALYRSHDRGATFEPVDLPAFRVGQIPGGFEGSVYDYSAETWINALSEDGLTWRELDLPEFRLPEPTS